MPWTTPAIEAAVIDDGGTTDVRTLSYRDAILEATTGLLETDPSFFVIGEGVDDASGVFGTTLGLCEKYGRKRILDSPLSENSMTGVAIGAAAAGMHPLFVHMRQDFLLLALDQLLNHAAKWCYMSNGAVSVPLTIRAVTGRGWGSAAQHSQSIQALLTHIPGIKVLMPSTAYDAKGLLVSGMRDPNPVIIIEHRWLYDNMGYVPAELYEVPLAKANICREGKDLSIVATGIMVHEAMAAAKIFDNQGISCEVIDLRSVKPWDKDLVFASVEKTGRLLVADNGHAYGGISSEIAATVSEKCWDALQAPVQRIALPEAPVPASVKLEQAYYPDCTTLVHAAQKILG
jgi:acetoin:2,6-dichlorophenolindophenol oxidoreductase subunit beta